MSFGNEFYFKMYTLAEELGLNEHTLRRWLKRAGLELMRSGKGPTSAVMLAKVHLPILRKRLLLANVGCKEMKRL